MAPPPPPKCPTTVLDLGDDLLREVFILLPALPSLVRAALACRTFLHAVRSSPAFRRRFRALHPSPFVGLFIQHGWNPDIPSFDAHHHPSDRDFAAAVRGGDFALTGLPLPDGDPSALWEWDWEIERCCDGYVVLFNRRAKQIAAYNPLTRALHLFPSPPKLFSSALSFEFHIVSSQEEPTTPVRVVYFYSDGVQALVGVISSDRSTDEWQQIFPETDRTVTGKIVNGSVYWTHARKPYLTVLNTATLQFSKMDLPPQLLAEQGEVRPCAFVLGSTKDGRPCIVSRDLSHGFVIFGRCDEHEEWILDQTVPLKTIRQFITFSKGFPEDLVEFISVVFINVQIMEVTDGILRLHGDYGMDFLLFFESFCLERAKLKILYENYDCPVHAYIMAWPPSLVLHDKGLCSKDQALSTPSSEGTDVKDGGDPTQPASVAKA